MNWAAMNYVKRLRRETGINGNLRFVMMMIASRIPRGYIETIPTSELYLAMVTGNDVKTVRNLTRKLIAKEVVWLGDKGRGRGRRAQTFVIPALAGPLFMVPPSGPLKPESLTGFTVGKPDNPSAEKPEHLSGFNSENRAFGAKSVRTRTSKDVRTKDPATAESPVAAVICDETLSFLNWCGPVYAEHVGASITIDYEHYGPRIEKVLKGPPRRPLERLQAMWIAMLTVTLAEDKFLAGAPDKGFRLFLYGNVLDRLDAIVARREVKTEPRRRPCLYKHDPPCVSAAACAERERQLIAASEATAAGGAAG